MTRLRVNQRVVLLRDVGGVFFTWIHAGAAGKIIGFGLLRRRVTVRFDVGRTVTVPRAWVAAAPRGR